MDLKQTAIFPGCSLESTSEGFLASLNAVLQKIGLPLPEVVNWTCCGSSSAYSVDHNLFLGLNAKNLAIAESQGFVELLTPCAACYHRLVSANLQLQKDPKLREKINNETGLHYKGTVKVRNVLDFLYHCVGPEYLKKFITQTFPEIKAVCYYGCLNTRVPNLENFDNVEYPMSMDLLLKSIGIRTIDWAYKTECCGASLMVTKEEIYEQLVSKIIKDAVVRGADCIVVSCPMCQSNLDVKQNEINEKFGIQKTIPILFITQIMGMVLGLTEKELAFKQNFVQGQFHAK